MLWGESQIPSTAAQALFRTISVPQSHWQTEFGTTLVRYDDVASNGYLKSTRANGAR